MRVEQAQTMTGPKEFLVAAVMDLSLVAAALLSLGGAPAKHATSTVEPARPKAAVVASATGDRAWPGNDEESATLDLQLD